jgi:type I restriction enzyme S subunit
MPYFPIRIPPIIEQKATSSLLMSIDKKIVLNNKINAELEAMAKLIYDYWFVQFDFPSDSPENKGKPYKSSGGKMVYNEDLKREIPDGWDVKFLTDWIESDKTGDWGKESEQGNYTLQVDCIRGADINGLNGKGKVKSPNRFILKKNSHKLLTPFDLIVEISGGSPTQSTGRMTFLTPEMFERFNHPLICSNFCKAISLKDNNYFYNFVYQWNALYSNGVLFGWEGKTSGIKNLLFDAFVSKHKVCKPPERIAKEFSKLIEPIQQKKQKALKENAELESLRDWLLPMLMTGQVTVKNTKEK